MAATRDLHFRHDQFSFFRKYSTTFLFIHVKGLEQVAFTDQGMGISLVSEGTETILVSKAFFLSHLSGAVLKNIRSTVRTTSCNRQCILIFYIIMYDPF